MGCGGKGYGAGLGGSETGEGWRAVLWHSSLDMGCDGMECRVGVGWGGWGEVWYTVWWLVRVWRKGFGGRLLGLTFGF